MSRWLEEAGVIVERPGTEIAETAERIMADGVVTEDERKELLSLLQRVDGGYEAGEPSKVSSSGSETKPAQTTTKVELTCVGNAGGATTQRDGCCGLKSWWMKGGRQSM